MTGIGTVSGGFAARLATVATATLLAAAAVAMNAPPSHATFEGENGPIFFRQGKNILSVNEDGTDKTVIARGSDYPGRPRLLDVSVSPNGRKIAFATGQAIWVKTVGGGRKEVTEKAGDDLSLTQLRYPAWSPDGKKLVFQAVKKQNGNFYARLYRINIDGTGIKQVIKFSSGFFGQFETNPDWSSTNRIAYSALDDLWLINPDGSSKTNLTADSDNYEDPSWSPDGEEIAVRHEGDGDITYSNPGIVAVDAETGAVRQITGNADVDDEYGEPSWSPDGESIAFSGFINQSGSDTRGVYKVASDESFPAVLDQVYLGAVESYEPAWGAVP